MTDARIILHPLFQMAAIMFVAAILAYATDMLAIRTVWNAAWIFGAPICLGMLANEGALRRLCMISILTALSVLSLMATAALFGLFY